MRGRITPRPCELLALQTEPSCWRQFVASSGTVQWLRPDLYVATGSVRFETLSFVEVDLGTEHLPTIRTKCAIYERYSRSGIEVASHDVFPAVVWVVPDERRAQRLRHTIDQDSTLTPSAFHVVTSADVLEVLAPPDEDASAQPKVTTGPERRNES